MTAKTPEELLERMVEAMDRLVLACNLHREEAPTHKEKLAAALSAADSAGWPQSLIDKARAQAIEECARTVEELDDGPITTKAVRSWVAGVIRRLSTSPKATP